MGCLCPPGVFQAEFLGVKKVCKPQKQAEMTSTFPVCSCIILSCKCLSLVAPNCRVENQSTLLSSSSLGTERVSDQLRMAQGSPGSL